MIKPGFETQQSILVSNFNLPHSTTSLINMHLTFKFITAFWAILKLCWKSIDIKVYWLINLIMSKFIEHLLRVSTCPGPGIQHWNIGEEAAIGKTNGFPDFHQDYLVIFTWRERQMGINCSFIYWVLIKDENKYDINV